MLETKLVKDYQGKVVQYYCSQLGQPATKDNGDYLRSLQEAASDAVNTYLNLSTPWESKTVEQRKQEERNAFLGDYNKLFEHMSDDEYQDMLKQAEAAWENPPGTEDPESDALLELQQRQQDRLDKKLRRR